MLLFCFFLFFIVGIGIWYIILPHINWGVVLVVVILLHQELMQKSLCTLLSKITLPLNENHLVLVSQIASNCYSKVCKIPKKRNFNSFWFLTIMTPKNLERCGFLHLRATPTNIADDFYYFVGRRHEDGCSYYYLASIFLCL